jgi:hypothetical protein
MVRSRCCTRLAVRLVVCGGTPKRTEKDRSIKQPQEAILTEKTSNAQVQAAVENTGRLRHISYYEWVLIALMTLAVVGIGITYFSPQKSYRYWITMVPVFGGFCLSIEWSRLAGKGQEKWAIVRDQLYHWFATLVAVLLVYLLSSAGKLNTQDTSLIILLLLALSTFLAGIQIGWRLYLIGFFLGVIIVMTAYLKDYLWVLILLGILAILAYVYLRSRRRQKVEPAL